MRSGAAHPKMAALQVVVLAHFKAHADACAASGAAAAARPSRVIIFTNLRDSVHQICDFLRAHEPLVKARCLVQPLVTAILGNLQWPVPELWAVHDGCMDLSRHGHNRWCSFDGTCVFDRTDWLPRRMFIGQGAGTKKGAGGMRQAEQKQVLADFRAGLFNAMVATCIGEEGLDIPQVCPLPSVISFLGL